MAGIGEIKIKTNVSEDFGTAELEVFVKMRTEPDSGADTSGGGNRYLWARLENEDGEEADRIFPVAAEPEVSFCMRVEAPCLWDAEQCVLYDLILELRGEEDTLLSCATKKIAFRSWDIEDGIYYLNGKKIAFVTDGGKTETACREMADSGVEKQRQILGEILAGAKRAGKNAVCVKKEYQSPLLQELCPEYGIYLLDMQPMEEQMEEALAGFEIQVVEQGALIENHSLFADAARYDLAYEIRETNRTIQSGRMETAIPPGSSRFVEIPFERPKESGNYRYRVSLCLKNDTPWAKKGYEAAVGEAVIANLWMG